MYADNQRDIEFTSPIWVTRQPKRLSLCMFIRKKKNRSGSVSIVVVDKSGHKYREKQTIGISSDPAEIERLCLEGQRWIHNYNGQQDLFTQEEKAGIAARERDEVERVLDNIDNILINGTQLILGYVFKNVGFNKIDDDILKQLVIARLCQPSGKSGTVDYLQSYFDEDVNLSKIYRYLDTLYNTQQKKIRQISVEHTRKILGGSIGLVFYDVTTLYFESDYGDELRETGFSKDGKHSQPQVVLGLLVSAGGYPLSYALFNGSQYEGRTMIPVIEDFVKRFNLQDFVVVADSGLMNKSNVELLESGEYKYIIGARIKNESREIKSWILSQSKQDNIFHEYRKDNASRLIVSYSSERAKKDAKNREKGVKRLQKAYGNGTVTKENINRRGYNKFLELQNNIKVSINNDKIKDDQQWDGLKGYITNTNLPAQQVYEHYHGLWVIEKAFRVTKGTLDIRPMFHFTARRIQAHVCICFVAYKVYKELERVLKTNGINLSVDKVVAIAKTITTIKVNMPHNDTTYTKTMLITNKHKLIAKLFDDDFWVTQ
jgi:transposase